MIRDIAQLAARNNDDSSSATNDKLGEALERLADHSRNPDRDHVSTNLTHDEDLPWNTSALPESVLARYEKRRQFLTRTDQGSFLIETKDDEGNVIEVTEMNYYLHSFGSDNKRLITRSGFCFDLSKRMDKATEKVFKSDFPKLFNETPPEIRRWYRELTSHALAHNVYVHPYFCFCRNPGDLRGFTIGDHFPVDLPTQYKNAIDTFSVLIATAIKSNKVISDSCTELKKAAKSFERAAGYELLYRIIRDSHPNYGREFLSPLLIYDVPKQVKGEGLEDYFACFDDYLRLKTYLTDSPASYDNHFDVTWLIRGLVNYEEMLVKIRKTQNCWISTALEIYLGRFTFTIKSPTVSVTVETVDEDKDDDGSLAAASVSINAVDIVQNCGNDTSISLDIPCESGGVFSFDDPNFDRDNPEDAIDDCYVRRLVPEDPLAADTYFQQGIRAQLDTGAKVSCTNQKHLLHDYKPYNSSRPCPIRLTAAIDGSKQGNAATPAGSGYLHLPAPNFIGYIKVFCYYSPRLAATLISENDLYGPTKAIQKDFSGQSIHKIFLDKESRLTGNLTIICHHRRSTARNIVLHGAILNGQCYSHPILIPDLNEDSPYANCATSSNFAMKTDWEFRQACDDAARKAINYFRYDVYKSLADLHQHAKDHNVTEYVDDSISTTFNANRLFTNVVEQQIPINSIKTRTAKLLWHQRLGHPCDEYLYNAHKFIDGVPKFTRQTSVLDQCPTCIQCKQTKNSPGKNTTRFAKQPYQGLSIDFAFSGMTSGNSERRKDFEGINGETAWILVTDNFTQMKHGNTRISKAAPLHWLEHFFTQYHPNCRDKYVVLDQSGELFLNPDARNLFAKYGYDIHVTGADSSHQNGQVERGHRTLSNSIRTLLTGASLDVKFWPYTFYHAMRLANAFPERGEPASPLEKATERRENLSDFRTFGCRVWVRPPGRRKAKLLPNARKGIFLGFVPYTTRNILWYDTETLRVKITNHARFDEGMNDLPIADLPPNVRHLMRADDGAQYPAEHTEVATRSFAFSTTPFADTTNCFLRPSSSSDATFGLRFRDDELLGRAYVTDIVPNTPASALFSTTTASRKRLRGSYIMSINRDCVFTAANVDAKLRSLHNPGVKGVDIPITFAKEGKLSAAEVRKHANEYNLFAPNTKWNEIEDTEDPPFLERTPIHQLRIQKERITDTRLPEKLHADIRRKLAPTEDDMNMVVPTIDIASLRAIARLHRKGNQKLPLDEDELPTEMIEMMINAINSKATTTEEQALGHFTRKKLQKLSTWEEWKQGERNPNPNPILLLEL